jgi:hypothetical protein
LRSAFIFKNKLNMASILRWFFRIGNDGMMQAISSPAGAGEVFDRNYADLIRVQSFPVVRSQYLPSEPLNTTKEMQ